MARDNNSKTFHILTSSKGMEHFKQLFLKERLPWQPHYITALRDVRWTLFIIGIETLASTELVHLIYNAIDDEGEVK